MAPVQIERGYARIANELLEALGRSNLSGIRLRIMIAVVRESFGWQQESMRMGYQALATKYHFSSRTQVIREMRWLSEHGYLLLTRGTTNTWGVQQDYGLWGTTSSATETSLQDETSSATETSREAALVSTLIPVTSVQADTPPHTPLNGERNLKKELSERVSDDSLKHPAVVAYRKTFSLTPRLELRKLIAEQVTDLDRWREALAYWQHNSYRPQSVGKLVDRYLHGDPFARNGQRPNSKTGPPLPPDPQLTMAEVQAAGAANIRTMIANGELPDDWPIPTGY